MNIKRNMLVLIMTLVAASLSAGDLERVTEHVDAEGAREISLTLEFGAGEITLIPADMEEAAIVDIQYNPRRVEYVVDYRAKGKTGILDLESSLRRKRNVDTEDNLWDMKLSTRYQMTVDMEIGAADAEMDFGGIPIEEFVLDIGAASGRLSFSKPNPIKLNLFDIDAGAASLDCEQLGNANFEEFNFSGGAGSFELDMRGHYDGSSRISIEIGLGSLDLVLPEDIPVQILTDDDGWLSSVDFHGSRVEEVDDGEWESDDFDGAKTKIIVELEIGLGSADIYFK